MNSVPRIFHKKTLRFSWSMSESRVKIVEMCFFPSHSVWMNWIFSAQSIIKISSNTNYDLGLVFPSGTRQQQLTMTYKTDSPINIKMVGNSNLLLLRLIKEKSLTKAKLDQTLLLSGPNNRAKIHCVARIIF